MKKGIIEKKKGLRVLRLEGSHYEMGYQHGKALRKEIQWIQTHLGILFARYEGAFAKVALLLSRMLSRILARKIPKEFREEMKGIADGAGVSYDFICSINLIGELGEIYYTYFKPSNRFQCSCFATKDTEGDIIWGRNLDYIFYEVLPTLSIIFVYVPQSGSPFISLSFPGIVGVLTGLSRGFDLIVLSSPARSRIFGRMPQAILNRQAIQYNQNLKEGIEKIISLPASMGENLVLVSKNTAKVIEISPQKKAIRSFQGGIITVTNHYQIAEMLKEQAPSKGPKSLPDDFFHMFMTIAGSKERAERMQQILQSNHIDVEKATKVLDSVSGLGTVQSIIAIPKKEEFWIAKRDQAPVTKGEWMHFRLSDFF